MSCWRNYTCNVLRNADKDLVKKALAELGVSLNENKHHIEAPWALTDTKSGNCDASFIVRGNEVPLGIIWKNTAGDVQVVGDFWDTGLDEETFVNSLSQIYQKINIETQLELNGYTVDSVTSNADGEIEIEAYAWA